MSRLLAGLLLCGGTVLAQGPPAWMEAVRASALWSSDPSPQAVLPTPDGGMTVLWRLSPNKDAFWSFLTAIDASGLIGPSRRIQPSSRTATLEDAHGAALYLGFDKFDLISAKIDLETAATHWSRRYHAKSLYLESGPGAVEIPGGEALLWARSYWTYKGLLLRTDASGRPLWAKRWDDCSVNHVALLSDGTFIVWGQTGNAAWMARMDLDGVVLAGRTFRLRRPGFDPLYNTNATDAQHGLLREDGLLQVSGTAAWHRAASTGWVLTLTPDLQPVQLREFSLHGIKSMHTVGEGMTVALASLYREADDVWETDEDAVILLDRDGTFLRGSTYYFSGMIRHLAPCGGGRLCFLGYSEGDHIQVASSPLHEPLGCGWKPFGDPTVEFSTLELLDEAPIPVDQEIDTQDIAVTIEETPLDLEASPCFMETPHGRPAGRPGP